MMSSRLNQCVTSPAGRSLPVCNQFEQQWRRDGVDEARRERDVAVPQFLEVQLHRLAMDANVRDASARAPQIAWQVSKAAGGSDSLNTRGPLPRPR